MPLIENKNVKVDKITVYPADSPSSGGYDIRNIVKEMVVYEDIFSSSITATLLISTSVNIEELLPFTGQDRVQITFVMVDQRVAGGSRPPTRTPISINLVVYKMSDVMKISDRAQTFTLDCVSPEVIQNEKTRVCKYFDKEFTQDIRDIFSTLGTEKKLIIGDRDKNKHKDKILIPNWKPFRAINFIANRCIRVGSGSTATDYLFFERIRKKKSGSEYVLSTINDLVGNGDVVKKYTKSEINTIDSSDPRQVANARNNVESYKIESSFNYLNDIERGSLAGRVITVDTTRKRRDIYDFSGFDDFKKQETLYNNNNTPEGTDKDEIPAESMISVVAKRKGLYARKESDGKVTSEPSSHLEETAWRRNAFMAKFGSTKCIIRVPGDSDIRVGDIVEWEIPSNQEMTTTKKYQRYLSKQWIISSVVHRINDNDGYTQVVELIKDSVVAPLPETKLSDILRGIFDFVAGAASGTLIGGAVNKILKR